MSDSQANCPRCDARPETTQIGALVALKCTGCGAAYLILPRVPEAPDDWDERFIGQRCGNCHLVSRVAVEEDGPVYEALHFGLNQPVHVKVLAPDLSSDPQMVQRFVRQAQLAARVIHPLVPRVLDIGPSQDVPYIIRERTQGQRLSAKQNGSALSIEEVTAKLPKITEALAAVHDAGIVHLNVKPHSIILSKDGGIHLVGFTAAMRRTERPSIIAGSPGYTAGEQIRGKDLGPSTDVFALGLLFHEMLTGRPAFSSEEEAALFAMPAKGQVPSDSSIPQPLAELIQRMTRRSTGDRIASCALVLKDLGVEPQAEAPKREGKISTVGRAVPGMPGKISSIGRALSEEELRPEPSAAPTPEQYSLSEPAATTAQEPDSDLEALFEPGGAAPAQPAPTAPSAPPAASPAAQKSTPSGKIHMQCPNCGLVVRGYPEVFANAIRCPDCNNQSTFKPESQETAPRPAEAPAAAPKSSTEPMVVTEEAAPAAPADSAAPKSTPSGKIHMQCPNCSLVVRGYPEVFANTIRCPDCSVESTFKPEKQKTAPQQKEKSGSGWKKWGSSLLKRRGP